MRVFSKLFLTCNLAALLAIFLVACGASATPTPPPTATIAPTNTASPTPTTAPTNTPEPTPTPRPTNTPIPTNTPPPPTATPEPTKAPAPTAALEPYPSGGSSPPHVFVGTVTVGGQPAVDGAVILALIDGRAAGIAHVRGGKFTLLVTQPDGETFTGKSVAFSIDDAAAPQKANWKLGEATILNLTTP